MSLFASKYFRLGLGLIVSALTLYLALRQVTLREVWSALSQAELRYLGLALLSVVVNNLAKTARWQVLISARGRGVSFGKLLMSLLIGQMFNNLYPARVGDLSRAYVVGGMGAGRVFVLGTVVVEKVLDMLSYALLFVFLLFLIPLPAWVNDSGYSFVGATLIVLSAVFVATWQRNWIATFGEHIIERLPHRVKIYLEGRLRPALSSLDVLQSRVDLLKLAFWSAIIWGTAILNNQWALLALGIHLPLTASLLILIALQIGISIPSVPARIGIFEYICVLTLAVFGIGGGAALSYGILLHALVLFVPILAGLISFVMLGLPKTEQDTGVF